MKRLNDNDWLLTPDVSSLYNNIPHEVGLETAKIKKYIYKDQEAKLPIDFVINTVTLVFDKKNIIYRFKVQQWELHYQQIMF